MNYLFGTYTEPDSLKQLAPAHAVYQYLLRTNIRDLPIGRYEVPDSQSFLLVQEYATKLPEEARFESHKAFIDVQCMLRGEEVFGVSSLESLTVTEPYSAERDVVFYTTPPTHADIHLRTDEYIVFFPKDGHQPGKQVHGQAKHIKKGVFKIPVAEWKPS